MARWDSEAVYDSTWLWDSLDPVRGLIQVGLRAPHWVSVSLAARHRLTVEVREVQILQRNVIEILARISTGPAYADPTTVSLRLKRPDGTEVTPAPVMTKLGTGLYRYYLDTQGLAAGVWLWHVSGDGLVDCAAEGQFTILASAFA